MKEFLYVYTMKIVKKYRNREDKEEVLTS